MIQKIYFISTEFLKSSTPIDMGVNDNILELAILDSQEIKLQQILGTELYEKMKVIATNGTIDTDPTLINYKNLMDDFIVPALVQESLHSVILYTRWRITNKSISDLNSDNSSAASAEDTKYLIDQIKNNVSFYEKRLSDHLKANYTLYPELYSAHDYDDINPERENYKFGIVFERGGGCGCSDLGLPRGSSDPMQWSN